jgi:hypothetical protein
MLDTLTRRDIRSIQVTGSKLGRGDRVVIDHSDGSLVIVHPGTLLTIKDFRAAVSVRELFDIAVGIVRVRNSSPHR